MEFINLFFRQGQWFWCLLAIPVVLLAIFCSWARFVSFQKQLKQKPHLYQQKLPSWWRRAAKAVFYCLGLALVISALADPYYLKKAPENVYKGIRLYFLLDVSRSMSMAEDIKPNRLEAAKSELNSLYNSLGGSYEISLIPFAGEANTYFYPPSFEQANFLLALNFISEDLIPTPGTNLTGAFTSLNQLVKDFGLRPNTVNIAILLSDGGKDESFAVNRFELQKEISSLARKGFRVYAVGIGGKKPTPLVVRDWAGNFQKYLVNGKTGQPYYSELDEDILRLVASAGNGDYAPFEKRGGLTEAIKHVIKNNSQLLEVKYRVEERSVRTWFFLAGIMIFLLGELHFRKK